MSNVPDYALEATLNFKFTSRAFATGAPTTLAGTPVIDIYEDDSLTQITAAETLTVDFDGVTGLNNIKVVASAANGFEAGKSYHCVLSAGTVDSVSVVGEVVAQFSIERSPVNWAQLTDGDAIGRAVAGIGLGTASGTPTTTNIPTSSLAPAATAANQFVGRIVTFDAATTTAALRGQSTDITASTSGGVLTVTALTTAPVSGDTFTIQ